MAMEVESQRYFPRKWPCAARSPPTTFSGPPPGFTSGPPPGFTSGPPPGFSSVRPSTFTAPSASPPSSPAQQYYCSCSPSTNPNSFRCSLHRSSGDQQPLLASSQSLNFRQRLMINNLLRLRKSGGDDIEDYMMMRVLEVQYAKLMRSSSNKPRRRRRSDFKQMPTRFRVTFMKEQGIMEEEKSS